MSILNFLIQYGPDVVTAASLVAAVTPTPSPDTTLGRAYKLVDLLAINFGRAKQTGDEA